MLTFIETPLFTKLVTEYLSDDEYLELQAHLAEHPETGPIIRGSGGVRKVRWSMKGRGKRWSAGHLLSSTSQGSHLDVDDIS